MPSTLMNDGYGYVIKIKMVLKKRYGNSFGVEKIRVHCHNLPRSQSTRYDTFPKLTKKVGNQPYR